MYSRGNFTNNVQWDTKPKKKYDLSLKKIKGDVQITKKHTVNRRDAHQQPKSGNETVESAISQDFKLRLSDSFAVDDTHDEIEEEDVKVIDNEDVQVILVSDSSDDGLPEMGDQTKSQSTDLRKGGIRRSMSEPNCVYVISSSDSTNNERSQQNSPKARNTGSSVKRLQRKYDIAYTSDEDISEDESDISRHKKYVSRRNESKVTKKLVTPTSIKNAVNDYRNLDTISDKFSELLNDESCESDAGVNRDVKKNLFYKSSKHKESQNPAWQSHSTSGPTKGCQTANQNTYSNSKKCQNLLNNGNGLKRSEESTPNKRGILCNGEVDENKITPATKQWNYSEKSLHLSSERLRGVLSENRCNIDKSGSTNSLNDVRHVEEAKRTPVLANALIMSPASTENNRKPGQTGRTPISAKISSSTTVLTKKDTRQILKAIKSKKAAYESPKLWKKPRHSDDSDVDEKENEGTSPEPIPRFKDNIKARNAIVIADSDSECEEVIQGSRTDISKPYKTHVTRFLDPTIGDDIDAGLSEKKKFEVTKWLLTNTGDSRCDSSVSNISGTKGSCPSSGNSSLERLEENYETPNNREKFKKIINNNRPTTAPQSVKTVRQRTIDEYIMKSRDGTHNVLTPLNNVSNIKRTFIHPAATEPSEPLEIMDCADILDNLYGTAWRARAEDVLPSSEPRRVNVARTEKGVQTERKAKPKTKAMLGTVRNNSQNDEFNIFVQNIKPNLNSTRKPVSTTLRRRGSASRDSSSSGASGAESTYLTALTTPRVSDNFKAITRQTPASLAIQKARAICDSDTDDESDKNYDYRKQLSFSDDENTSTSEYDPNDEIPPKPTTKTLDALRTSKNVNRTPKAYLPKTKITKTKTFLESLCATVPLQEAHQDAKKYRQSYKTTKEELSKHLYQLFNDKVFDNKLPKDMSIEWNVRMRGTAGYCYNKRSIKALGGVTRSSRIVLATKILDTPDRLRDTLIHEMCHAAAWLINEVSDGHGPFWKGWASKAMKTFPELPPIRRCHDYKIKTKFTYRCTGCGYSIGRHSKSLDVEKKRCGHCYGKFELLINRVTKSGRVEMQTPTSKQPSGFALFVKENYHSVKKDRQGVGHKEVMQILGQQFSAIKITKKMNNCEEHNS